MKKLFLVMAMLVGSYAHAYPDHASVLVLNADANKTEYVQNGDVKRPIASITKLMTAMVTLDYDKDLSRKLMLSNRVQSNLPKQEYTRKDLLLAMLVKSDNAAAETLANDYPGGRSEFIKRMNLQARMWNMDNTSFSDPAGLGVFNLSTVYDVANMVQTASDYWFIRDVSTKKEIVIEQHTKKKTTPLSLSNTNKSVLDTFNNIVVSKTGLTRAAGWCISMLVAQESKNYVIVVLGSKNKNERMATVTDIMHSRVLNSKT